MRLAFINALTSISTKMDNAPIKTSKSNSNSQSKVFFKSFLSGFTLAKGSKCENPGGRAKDRAVTGRVVRHKLLKNVSKNRMKLAWDSFKIRSKSLLKIITVKGEDITVEACRSCLNV